MGEHADDLGRGGVSMMVVEKSKTKSLGNVTAAAAAKNMSRMKVRRQSFGFGTVPGIRPVERTSQVGIEFKRPILTYYNTYQLDPTLKFNVYKVTEIVNETLEELFTGQIYNIQESPALSLRMAGEIMRKVKNMQFNRYRVITVVTIAQKRSQSYNNAIAFLWDHERDNYVNVQKELTTTFVQVTVFGVYLD